jgi:fused signal recognition particle receptor
MFEFLKKKPVPAPDAKPVPATPAAPAASIPMPPRDPVAELAAASPALAPAPARTGWSPDELASAFVDVQAEKAARLEAEKAAARVAVRETLGASLLARSLGGLFSGNPRLDEDLLDHIETALIGADVGVTATTDLVARLRKRMKAREFADAAALQAALRDDLLAILAPIAVPLEIDASKRPFVILTVGVNGVGKTTTIGKLARRFQLDGHSLMLAAGDTFRAAAVEQLKIWGERNDVVVISQGQNADAASVAFDALQAAKSRGFDVLIADTAGRLHTQAGLMAELGKIRRVLGKLDGEAPHEVLLVIDGTTGQNALSQLRAFHAAVGVTGLVVTKLDGSAKGGVLFALAREFGIPIRYIGLGEKLDDLRVFDPEAFVDALLPERLGA